MGTSKLNESQPIFRFLRPARAQTTTFGQPTEGSLHHPTTSGELRFARDGTLLDNGFIATTSVFDMSHIAFLLNKLMDIRKVITFIKTHVLFNAGWVRPRRNNGNDNFINQPFIMLISPCHIDRQRRTAFIDQNMNFATAFGSIHRAFACRFTSQRRWTRLTVNSLPSPGDSSPLVIEFRQLAHQLVKNTAVLPFLEALMDGGATHPEPVSMHRLPLTTRPQHIPYPIDHSPIIGSFASRPCALWLFRQVPSQASPQGPWHSKIIDILWLLGMILVQDVSVLIAVWLLQSERDTSPFSTSFLFTDRYLVNQV